MVELAETAKALDDSIIVGSRTAKMATYVLFGKVLTFIMVGIALILVTRLLGPAQYGVYTLAVAFAGIFGSIGYSGIGTAVSKFISEYKQKAMQKQINSVLSNAFFMVLIAGGALTLISIALSSQISGYIFHTSTMSPIVEAVSLWIITAMMSGVFYDALVGFGDGKGIAIIVGIQSFFQSSISIVLAIYGFGAFAPIYGLVIGYFIGFFAGVLIAFRRNGFALTMPSVSYMKKLVSFSGPVAISIIISSVVGNIALIFLGYFAAPQIIGNVGVTARTGTLIGVIFDSITYAILPSFSAALSTKKGQQAIGKLYGYTLYLAVAIVSPILFYMAIFSTPFSYTIFGSSYSLAPLYISIMSIGLLITVGGTYASTLLISANKVKDVLKYNIVVYTLALVVMLIAIYLFAGLGYVVSTYILLPLMLDFIFIRKLYRDFGVKLKVAKLAKLIIANLIVCCIAFIPALFINGIPLLIASAIIFIVAYPLIAALIGGIGKEDVGIIRNLSSEVPIAGYVLNAFMDYIGLVLR